MDKDHFAQKLRLLRLEKGYTQEQLSEEMDVSPQTVSRWECANTLPDALQLPKLARLYGVTVDDFYQEEIRSYPNYAQRLLAVYESTLRTEDFLKAEQEFIRLLAGNHTADDVRAFGVLFHYMAKRCAAQAREYLESAMAESDPSDWVYYSAAQQKIALLCDLGQGMDEAIRYDKELEKDLTDPQRWLLCISAHHYAKDNEKAYELVKNAITLFPKHPALHVYAGDICKALQRYEEAFIYWNQVRELDNSFLDASYSMGFCYEELGQYRKALIIWRELEQELTRRRLTQECKLPAQQAKICEEQMGQKQ